MADAPMREGSAGNFLLLTTFLLLGCACLFAALCPITQDEAYYAFWSEDLAWGYFDHPPLVALGHSISRSLGDGKGRLLGCLLQATSPLGLWLLIQALFKEPPASTVKAGVLLLCASPMALLGSFLATPDVYQWTAWLWALAAVSWACRVSSESYRALLWVAAGFATGLGFLAKYTAILLVLIFALFLLLPQGRAHRFKLWPYLGGLVALLTVLPHISWQSQNQWVTVQFQWKHGFSTSSTLTSSPSGADLFRPLPPTHEEQLLAAALGPSQPDETPDSGHALSSAISQIPRFNLPPWARSLMDFLAGQIAMLGLGWFCLLRGARNASALTTRCHPEVLALFNLSCLLPLGFFGTVSLFGKVEANWAVMGWMTAVPLLLAKKTETGRLPWKTAFFHFTLAGLLVAHACWPFLPIPPKKDRLLAETHGYEALAQFLKPLRTAQPVLCETYQHASMLHHYDSHEPLCLPIPGLTRPSQFSKMSYEHLGATAFLLVTNQLPPPHFENWRLTQIQELRDCLNMQTLRVRGLSLGFFSHEKSCVSPHTWFLSQYAHR